MASIHPLRVRTSIASTHSTKERKFSTDRLQRQAHQSILNEESRIRRPSLVNEEIVDHNHVQFSVPDFENITTLSRAATAMSPLEMHPGQLARMEDLMPVGPHYGSSAAPFPEPSVDKQASFPLQIAVTTSTDVEEASGRVGVSNAQGAAYNAFLKRSYNRLRGRKTLRSDAAQGKEHVSALEQMQNGDIPHHLPTNRQVLYVLEYDKDRDGMLRCIRPNDAKSYESPIKLREYLNESTSNPLLRIMYAEDTRIAAIAKFDYRYACNIPEAVEYLTEAFSIDDGGYRATDKSFRDWIQTSRNQRGASNKVIKWRPSWDQARDVICTAFGLDFGSIILGTAMAEPNSKSLSTRTLHQRKRQSTVGPNGTQEILQQRISVYLQRSLSAALPGPRVTRFKSRADGGPSYTKVNTMIMFEYSSGKIGEIVNAPELLGLYSGQSVGDHSPDSAAPWIMEGVLIHIYDRISQIWRDQISLIHEDHAHLEDLVFDDPSNEARATEVWTMLEYLHDMVKLVNRHEALIKDFQEYFGYFAERDEEQEWLDTTIRELAELANDIQTDYIQPLNSLIDLIYKSVTIRDSRQSLDLSASLWRLSWITFIFLPLTFLSGFFGMNVNSFMHYPSIKWYFVAAVAMMAMVLIFWYAFRQVIPASYAPRSVRYSDSEVLRLRNTASLLRHQQSSFYPQVKAIEQIVHGHEGASADPERAKGPSGMDNINSKVA